MLVAATLYGISPILAKVAYASGVTPLTLLSLRATFGTLFVWIGLAAMRRAVPLTRPLLAPLLVLGMTIVPAQVFAYFYALTVLPASSASVIANTSPVHVAWMGRVFLGESLQPADLGILAAIVSGAMLVAGQTPHGGHVLALVVLAAGTLGSSFYLVAQRRLVQDVHPLGVLAVVLPASAVVYWGVGFATNQIHLAMQPTGLLAVAALTISAATASVFVLVALRTLPATHAAMLGMLEPVVAVVCSVLLLGDEMTWLRAVGIATVVSGIAALQLRRAA